MPLTAASARAKDTRASTPTMTHQHFAYIARVIREMEMSAFDTAHIAHQFAAALALTNPRFDRTRFHAAVKGGDA